MNTQSIVLRSALSLLLACCATAVGAETEANYRVVEKDGVKTYCQKRIETGSHVKKQKTCLTEKEMDELKEATQRSLRAIGSQRPPPHGT